jgi:hypothetical protein
MSSALTIAGVAVKPGEEKRIELPSVYLYTDTPIPIPVYVKRGLKDGPVLLVSAAIHGDEINGIEIISRLINNRAIKKLRGTLIAVPMVNVYGVINQSRYMPDRRDLNRSFPGSARGSLAGRIAHLFLNEIVAKCDFGIDLHTGAIHRSNLPQIRANLDDDVTRALAYSFGVPVLLNADIRDGSLRESAARNGVPMLLYEAGEALRFDELSIRAGVRGIVNVMRHLGMLNKTRSKKTPVEPFVARNSTWVRASDSGIVSHKRILGDYVKKDDVLAVISNPFGETLDTVTSPVDGIIIGKQNIPLAQEGEAMYHIAYFKQPDGVVENLELLQDNLSTSSNDNLGYQL